MPEYKIIHLAEKTDGNSSPKKIGPMNRNTIGALIVILSLGLLIPGLTLPMFHFEIQGSLDATLAQVQGKVIDETRSILGMVKGLWQRDRKIVAVLIFAFSAAVPALKAGLILTALSIRSREWARKLYNFVNAIAKWSMADVFVVAVLLTFMSTSGHQQSMSESINAFGFQIPLKLGMNMESNVLEGFYYFTAYCLVSMLAMQVIKIRPNAS